MTTAKHILSKIGGRTENQDFFGTIQTNLGELFIVCDGMGGHSGGKIAAELAVKHLVDTYSKSIKTDVVKVIEKAIQNVNKIIWRNDPVNRMGTTLAALILTPTNAISFHVGDSRIYQIRDDKLIFRTFDHSHVFEMVQAGILSEEQARLSNKSNIITRALGINSSVKVDITSDLSIQKGDRFLICTDGIWNAIPEQELINNVSEPLKVEEVLSSLVERIDAIGFTKGGKHDNMTAILIEIG